MFLFPVQYCIRHFQNWTTDGFHIIISKLKLCIELIGLAKENFLAILREEYPDPDLIITKFQSWERNTNIFYSGEISIFVNKLYFSGSVWKIISIKVSLLLKASCHIPLSFFRLAVWLYWHRDISHWWGRTRICFLLKCWGEWGGFITLCLL